MAETIPLPNAFPHIDYVLVESALSSLKLIDAETLFG